ncbi:serine/threonine protein kinase [Dictyobacter halimunensis]
MQGSSNGLVGKMLGTCTLEKLIGKGGMGAVYLARQQRPIRQVAVKVLHSYLGGNDGEFSQEFLTRFRREADVVARLEHMNIMPLYEYGEQDGLAYLVMPYLTGGSLSERLKRQGALPLGDVVSYMDQAASALDYAHAQGVIHRDLKPANFLLHADGRLVLTDFGIARFADDVVPGAALTRTGVTLGTPEYMAPEMALGEAVDYRADIYELGVVLYTLLSGHVPFTGSSSLAVITRHLQETLPLLHQAHPEIPAGVDAVIQKATAKDRMQRYASVRDMARALHAAIEQPNGYQALGEDAVPTVIQPGGAPTILAANTPPSGIGISDSTPTTRASAMNYGPFNERSSSSNTPVYLPTPPPPPPPRSSFVPPKQKGAWWLVPLLVICAVVLVLAVVITGTQLFKNNAVTGVTGTPTAQATPTSGPTATPTAAPTATPAPKPTSVPTQAPPPASGKVPTGPLLYSAASPGPACDTGSGTWTIYNGANINCQSNGTQITNTATSQALQGIFLTALPGKNYPNDYVLEVNVQQVQSSNSSFGLYFRNQPGNQQGTYTFLIAPDGSWQATVYDNATGAPKVLSKGTFGDTHAASKLMVVVKGSQFNFYSNGKALGSVSDATYASGTVGLAVDQGGTVTVSNFAMYATA